MRHAVTLRGERLIRVSSGSRVCRASEKQSAVRHFQIFIVLPSLSDVSAELQEEPLYKNDTGTTNIVNSQMDVVFSNSQSCGFNKSSNWRNLCSKM
jgi:hypothetical protein